MGNNDRLALFEGIIIGIYGNWLISLIDKISFTTPLIIAGYSLPWFQPFLVILSTACLVSLIAIGIFGGKLETRWEVIILGLGHFAPICVSLYVEGLILKDIFFLFIGGILFFMIYTSELWRARQIERTKAKR
ncbi:MAG: hypothetical protein H3Z50_05700 [archaeon]|nr:hypothetical protein [archaeon]MCP8306308.1 hypothetical protein [archaeon]